MADQGLIRETACAVVDKLKAGVITPLDCLDALEARITAVDDKVNALPTLCFDRARAHAKALMQKPVAERGVLAGLPVPIKDLTDVQGVLTTQGSLIKFRREFDQYVNLRPVRLMPGVPSPLAGRKPGDIDFWVVRENTEGEYSSVGGRMFPDTDREFVTQQTVMTRTGVDRILKFAFELAQSRPKKHLTSATKSNGISITMPYWDERVEAMAKNYPGVKWDKYHIDILTANFVLHPDWFDVVVGSNLFGDILSDLGPACTGTIGIAPSGNINPERNFPSVFEPVHGSAPDIAGQGIANPIGMIWSGAMMLEHLGEKTAAQAIVGAIERTLAERTLRTRDLGGNADTEACGKAVAEMVD